MSEPLTHTQTQLHKTVSQSSKNWISPFRLASANTTPKKKVKNEANYSSYISAGNIPVKETSKAEDNADVDVNGEIVEEAHLDETPLDETPLDETALDETPLDETPLDETALDETPLDETPLDETALDETPLDETPLDETPSEETPTEANEESEVSKEAIGDSEPFSGVVDDTPIAEGPIDKSPAIKKPTRVFSQKKEVKPALLPVPALIKSRPKMFSRYKENFNITSSIMNKNRIENLDRRVNLGAGLVLTEEQIYELAKKKLQPLMKQIDDKVAENNARDAEKAFQVEENIRIKDEGVVATDLAQYKAGVDAKIATAEKEHNIAFKEIENKATESKQNYEKYIQDEKDGIVKDQEDAEKAEEDAIATHEKNKVELVENAEQFKIDKTKELEDVKAKQIEEADLTEKFKVDIDDLKSKQVSLQSELDAKRVELEEKINKVQAMIAAKHEKKQIIRSSTKRKNIAERDFNIINSKHLQATANVGILASQVGLLSDRVNAHSTKINHFNTAGKESLVQKKIDATKASEEWAEHLVQVRLEEAQKQEQIRIAAEEERKRVEQEKIEEEERLARQKEEEETRLAKEKEEAIIAAEKKKKQEEEEAARVAEEVERLKRLKQLNEEKMELQKSVEAQQKEQSKIEPGVLSGVVGVTTGAVAGAAIAGGSLIHNAASGTSNAIGNIANTAASSIPQNKSAEIPSYQQDLENSNISEKKLNSNNPFYAGEFNDDLPSTIHEEEDGDEISPKVVSKDKSIVKKEVYVDANNDNETMTDEIARDSNLTTHPVAPVGYRKSMVDEAIANMTPEQIAKMNAPLVPKVKKSPSKTSLNEEVKPVSRSRSNSLTSKFTLKRTKSKSRSNSLKGSNPMKSTTTASNRAKVSSSSSKTAISAPVAVSTAVATATNAEVSDVPVPNVPAEDLKKVDTSVISFTPSGVSEKPEISEAQVVQIKTNEEFPEKVNSNITQEDAEDADLSDDSELPTNTGPIFTERVDDDFVNGDTAPTTAGTNNADYVEVSTLETIDSAEYFAHKDDPNYMVIN